MPRSFFLALLLCLAATAASANMLEGKPDVVDGATLRIAGQDIHLYAVKPPAPGSRCQVAGEEADCGFQATNALAFITAFQWVQCQVMAPAADGSVGRCFLAGRYDIGEKMVRAGWARANRNLAPAYGKAEDAAHAEAIGIWAGRK